MALNKDKRAVVNVVGSDFVSTLLTILRKVQTFNVGVSEGLANSKAVVLNSRHSPHNEKGKRLSRFGHSYWDFKITIATSLTTTSALKILLSLRLDNLLFGVTNAAAILICGTART